MQRYSSRGAEGHGTSVVDFHDDDDDDDDHDDDDDDAMTMVMMIYVHGIILSLLFIFIYIYMIYTNVIDRHTGTAFKIVERENIL